MDPLNILSRLTADNPTPPTDVELAKAATDLRDALDAATTAETPDLELARTLREAVDTVTSEQTARAEAAEAAREEARKLRDGIFTDTTEETETTEDTETTEVVEEPEAVVPVAASVSNIIERLKNHARTLPVVEEPARMESAAQIKPVGPASGYSLDEDAGFGDLGSLFAAQARSVMQKGNPTPLARLTRSFSDARQLGSNVDLNNRKIADALGTGRLTQAPIAASGGLCGPGDVDHSHPICSEGGRPVRDALPQFNASRGTVTMAPAAALGDMDEAVSVWTAETDADPQSETKPCPPVNCPEEITASVDAVVRCLTVGNFQAKFSPEFWASRLELLMIAHDRLAEQKILEEIYDDSTSIGSAVNEGNTLSSFLQTVNSVIAGDRSANRNWTGRYKVIADAYLRDYIRNQVIANLGVANNIEALQVADAQINQWLSDVGADVIWTPDGTYTGSAHRVLAGGTTAQNPTAAGVLIFPEDSFLFLDGGTLDLGTEITDSALNATNDRQAFAESFEKTLFRGCSSYQGVITIAENCGCDLGSI